ncbi:hypothetical protein P261_01761 [Lachnospiraceae bacterium TWA4]|nr:hypothetical protein P261_01761 [Lachnospiraceae bacterium TWA4]
MNQTFEFMTALQYQVQILKKQVEGFKTGERYVKIQKEHEREVTYLRQKLKKATEEIVDGERRLKRIRIHWFEVYEDLESEHQKEVNRLKKQLKESEKRAIKAENQRDEFKEKLKERTHEYYEVGIKLEEEQGRNKKLLAQLNRDFENSSIASSKTLRYKKITNNREKSGRKPGAQPGHKGTKRKWQTPTKT